MIYIYKNLTPNSENTTHYIFRDIVDYVNGLGDPFMRIETGNYTLNNNVLRVKLPLTTDFHDITYIAWRETETFYFVERAEFQSGYAVLFLSVDLWATYISKCTISKIRVNRCNRNIGNGVYDPIPVTTGREFDELKGQYYPDGFTIADTAIIYTVAFATGVSSVLVNQAGAYLGTYATEIDLLLTKTIDYAVALVGGIYSAAATIGDLDANVIKAYLVPKNYFVRSGGLPTFNTKTPNYNGQLTPEYEIAPAIFTYTFTVPIDPNYKYFVGTKLNGIEIERTTQPVEINYSFIFKQDGLQVIVSQGSKQLDITEAFQIGLTNNDGNITASQQIARILQTMTGIAGGYFQVASGGAGLVTGFSSMSNAIQNVIQPGNAKYTAGGDGVTTFRNVAGNAQSPFYMQKNKSIDDEQAHAKLYGAVFNQQLDTIYDVFSAPFLIEGTEQTYIAANSAVDGVPANAGDLIRSKLQAGIYLKQV